MTTLDEFLKALDVINDYCETHQDYGDDQECCDVCILKDCCLDIPVRTSFETTIRATKEALETIKKEAKNGEL